MNSVKKNDSDLETPCVLTVTGKSSQRYKHDLYKKPKTKKIERSLNNLLSLMRDCSGDLLA